MEDPGGDGCADIWNRIDAGRLSETEGTASVLEAYEFKLPCDRQ
jgi:hypothetical protein